MLAAATLMLGVVSCITAWAEPNGTIRGKVYIVQRDGARSYIPEAPIELRSEAQSFSTISDNTGSFVFPPVPAATYTIKVEYPGMKAYEGSVVVTTDTVAAVEVAMEVAAAATETVTVSAEAETPALQATVTSSGNELPQATVSNAPNINERAESLLPLVPGVVRGPDGLINMKGGRASQGTTLINSASVSDPVTGSGGFTLPIDVVSDVQVIANPYDPEYGKLAGAVAIFGTRQSAFDKYHFSIQNFMPRTRRRDGSIVGIESATPRLTFTGPVKHDRVAITQSFEYRFVRTPVDTLPPLERDTELESFDSYTAADFKLTERQTATFSVCIFPQKLNYLGLNTFTPQPATPDFHQRGHLWGIQHRYVFGSGALLSTQVSIKRLDADVIAHSDDLYRLEVETKAGGFFNRQARNTDVSQWQENYELSPKSKYGLHSPKLGVQLVHSSYDGLQTMKPVEVLRASGLAAERIDFTRPVNVGVHQNEATAFAADKWTIRSRLTLDLGARYDHDSITGSSHVSPRGGFALAVDNRTVIRGGGGVFYDKVNLNVPTFTSLPERIVTTYDTGGLPLESIHYSYWTRGALRNPRSLAWSGELDRQIASDFYVRFGYQQRQTVHDFIVDPSDNAGTHYLSLINNGRSHYREFQVTARYRLRRNELNASYVRSTANGDLNDLNQFFGNVPQPIIRSNEKSQLSFDVPNRFMFWGQFNLPYRMILSPVLDWHTGFPYSTVNEELDFVGPRNRAGRFPQFASFDSQLTKDFTVHIGEKKVTLRAGVRVFNALNHYNPRDVQNNLGSGRFGTYLNSVDRLIRGKLVMEF